MQKYTDTVQNRLGMAVEGAKVLVTDINGSVATIFSNNGTTQKSNPMTTDANGRFAFYAADGRYNLTITINNVQYGEQRDILLNDPADPSPEKIDGGVIVNSQVNESEVNDCTITGGTAQQIAVTGSTISQSELEDVTIDGLPPMTVGGQEHQALAQEYQQLTAQSREALRRSYADAGFTLIDGSFEEGGTLTSSSDVLLHKASGKAYSWTGAYPVGGYVVAPGTDPAAVAGYVPRADAWLLDELASAGGAQLVKNSVRWFDSIQLMLAATDLELGQKVCTGSTVWKITTSAKGWPLDNGTQYALPLNGVYVEDAGADPLGVADSYAAIMYVVSKFNADTKRRFAVCLGGGYYKTSGEIALHSLTSYIHINGGGATLEATSDMPALISCPGITRLRIKGGIQVQHSSGVTIASAMIHINNESANTSKTTRHIIDDISAGLITGAPRLLLCDKMWESEIRRIRADRDVAGMTGELVELKSCVNCNIQPCELGYCAVAWRLSKNPNVSYGCEGITFNGGVTAYAKVPIAVDNGTAIRLKGMVLDFCETSGPTFTNGADATIEGCWIANTATSNSWNGVISLPTFSGVKVTGGNHFVNNSVNTANCGSINSPDSIFAGNTSKGCLPGFRYANGVQEYGNQHGVKGVGINQFRGLNFLFAADSGIAPNINFASGKSSHVVGQLLQRITLSAPSLNSAQVVQIDHLEGNFSDIPVIKIAWNGAYKYALNFATGNIEILSAGGGVKLTSPDGLTTKTLRLSNAGTIELI